MALLSGEKNNIESQKTSYIGVLGFFLSAVVAVIAGFLGYLRLYFLPSHIFWVVFYLLLIIGTGYLYLRKKYSLLIRIVLLAILFICAVALIFSGNGPALLAWVWLAALSAGMGNILLGWLKLGNEDDTAEHLLIGAALGLGILALITYALGSANVFAGFLGLPTRYFKLLHPLPVYLTLAALTVLVAPRLFHTVKTGWKTHAEALKTWSSQRQPEISLSLAVLGLCFLAIFIWALSPSIRYDSLVYHLAAPQRYADYHGIVEVTEPMHFYLSHYAEMLYTLALVVVGQPLPSLLHLLSGLVTLGLTFLIARRLGLPRVGWIAVLLFFTLPIFYDAGTAYTDFFVALFSLASFYSILAWWQDHRFNWLVLGGVLAGLSIGTKINAAMPALAGGLAIFAGLLYSRTGWKRSVVALAGYSFPVLLMYVPWAVLNGLWTHNPFFPFFCQAFACSSGGITSAPLTAQSFLPALINNFLLLPWNVTVLGNQYYPENLGGVAGGIFLFSIPWLFFNRQADRKLVKTGLLLAVFSALNFLLLLPFSNRIRYMLPIIPILCILAAINLTLLWDRIQHSSKPRIWISAGFLLLALYFFSTRLVVTSSGWQMAERYPYQVALGFETQTAYLSRTLPVYDALQFLNKQADGNFKVASFGSEVRYYTTADIHTFYFYPELAKIVTASQTAADLARGLKQHGYKYILYDPDGLKRSGITVDTRMVSEPFLSQFARLVFLRNNIFLYELFPQDDPLPLPPGENLLSNGGFEKIESSGALSDWMVYNNPLIDPSGAQAHAGRTAVMASDQDYVYQRVSVQGGHLYTLGHWSRSDSPGEKVRLQVMWLDRKAMPISVMIEYIDANQGWTWNQLSYSAPENAIFAQVYVTTGSNTKAWFDGICFVEGPDCGKVKSSE